MPKRHKISKKKSRRNFKSGARVKRKNFSGAPMRGGIRL